MMTETAERLCSLLSQTLKEARFTVGQTVFKEDGFSSTRYDNRETLSAEEVRELHKRNRLKDIRPAHARPVLARIPSMAAGELAALLRVMLAEYIDDGSDRIGVAFPLGGTGDTFSKMTLEGAGGCTRVPSLEIFGAGLLSGAAVVGPNSMTELIERWAQGKPIHYRTCSLAGVTLEKALSPMGGMDIVPLPTSSDELPAALPRRKGGSPFQYLARTVVSVETTARPALFHPDSKYAKGEVDIRISPKLGIDNIETIYDALSLQCDEYIGTGLQWNDYGELSAMMDWATPTTWKPPITYLVGPHVTRSRYGSDGRSTVYLRDGASRVLSEKEFCNLLRTLVDAPAQIRMAVTRWRNSKRPMTSLTSQFIELRIALESLFLSASANQELKFRLTVTGSWFLGKDQVERKNIWDILRKAYDAASRAVHVGKVKENDSNWTLLADAQGLCRTAILRVLREGAIVDAMGLIFGGRHRPHNGDR